MQACTDLLTNLTTYQKLGYTYLLTLQNYDYRQAVASLGDGGADRPG